MKLVICVDFISIMLQNCWWFFLLIVVGIVMGYPSDYFVTKKFKVGIEYENSLPMDGASDRYRHINNYDPFFVTVSTTAKDKFVISYMEITATIDALGEVDFTLVSGTTGSKTMVFQLVSNHTDFLSYSYLAYGIKEEEYRKLANIITLPFTNDGIQIYCCYVTTLLIGLGVVMRNMFHNY